MARLGTGLCMMALFIAIYAGLPVGRVVVGVMIGAVLWGTPLELSRRFVRSQSPAVNIVAAVIGAGAAALCGMPFGIPMMIAGAAIPLAITGSVLAAADLRRRRNQRLLANLVRRLRNRARATRRSSGRSRRVVGELKLAPAADGERETEVTSAARTA